MLYNLNVSHPNNMIINKFSLIVYMLSSVTDDVLKLLSWNIEGRHIADLEERIGSVCDLILARKPGDQ